MVHFCRFRAGCSSAVGSVRCERNEIALMNWQTGIALLMMIIMFGFGAYFWWGWPAILLVISIAGFWWF